MLPDAIREMNKYSENEGSKSQNQHQHLEQELRNHMVLFRAQRNFYITGFSLFLVFVIRRLMTLLNSISSLTATSEANLRQAESASRVAQEFLSKQDSQNGDKEKTELEEKIEKKDEELCNAKKDLSKALSETEAMKSQAEAVAREYDRLMEEHANLQKQLALMERDGKSDKKDDWKQLFETNLIVWLNSNWEAKILKLPLVIANLNTNKTLHILTVLY